MVTWDIGSQWRSTGGKDWALWLQKTSVKSCEEITPACLSGNEVAIAALKAIGLIENMPCNVLVYTGNSA